MSGPTQRDRLGAFTAVPRTPRPHGVGHRAQVASTPTWTTRQRAPQCRTRRIASNSVAAWSARASARPDAAREPVAHLACLDKSGAHTSVVPVKALSSLLPSRNVPDRFRRRTHGPTECARVATPRYEGFIKRVTRRPAVAAKALAQKRREGSDRARIPILWLQSVQPLLLQRRSSGFAPIHGVAAQ